MADKLTLKINLPLVKLELTGNPAKHIPELRKFFSELRRLTDSALDSEAIEDVFPSLNAPFWKLSRDVQKNDSVMELLTQVSQVENGTIIRKMSIENINELTDKGTVTRLNLSELKKSLRGLFDGVDKRNVNCIFVHVLGNVKKDEFSIIVDQVMKDFPHARFERLHTKKEALGKTLVECMLFGNLPEEN